MLKTISAVAIAVAFTASPALAQDHSSHRAETRLMKGSSVAIEGCVTPGQKAGSFVLGSVKEIPGQPVHTGLRRVYWLDKTSLLSGHAGHRVQIAGRIDKVEQHEMEVKLGADGQGGAVVEIEGPGDQVKTAPATVGVGTAGQKSKEVDIPITVVRLKIDSVKAVEGSCGSAGR